MAEYVSSELIQQVEEMSPPPAVVQEPPACDSCSSSLAGKRYVMKDDRPHCMQCFETKIAHTCNACGNTISVESKDLYHGSRHWHEKCFVCNSCSTSLADQPFIEHEQQIYCSHCHENKFAARCISCALPFKAGMQKFDYKGQQWHFECFVCALCKKPIGEASFVPRPTDFVCIPCYHENIADKCKKCNEAIRSEGVSYKQFTYHKDCFVCHGCNIQLAGQKFTTQDDEAYCINCYSDLFAKKCAGCCKSIAGFDGEKFITFEDRSWHSSCFVCTKCEMSMAGKGFLMENNNVICPECGEA